eukprot:1027876-Amphidinium_carterae.2
MHSITDDGDRVRALVKTTLLSCKPMLKTLSQTTMRNNKNGPHSRSTTHTLTAIPNMSNSNFRRQPQEKGRSFL